MARTERHGYPLVVLGDVELTIRYLAGATAASSLLVDGIHHRTGDATPLAGAMTLDVLPPFADG